MDYSNKDFTGRNLTDADPADFTGQTIHQLCLSQETPDSDVLPLGVTDCTLLNCNLDNCTIPAGYTVEGGSTRRYAIQEDGMDWLIDANNNPLEPM